MSYLPSGDGPRPSGETIQVPNHPPTDQPLPPRDLQTRLQEYEASGWQLAPQYEERLSRAEASKEQHRLLGNESWGEFAGSFAPLSWETANTDPREDFSEVRNLELVIKRQILDILDRKRKNGDNSPVIVMDFGGMYGESVLRLAKNFAPYINTGDVAFVVTNIAFTPQVGLATRGNYFNHLTNNDVRLIEENMGLVHYLNADAEELHTQRIAVPNHGDVSLHGNVDIIHEDYALTHSLIPDTDLPTLATSLSPYGTLFLGSTDIHPNSHATKENQSLRQRAFHAGLANIDTTGVTLLSQGERSYPNYAIYVKPESPTTAITASA